MRNRLWDTMDPTSRSPNRFLHATVVTQKRVATRFQILVPAAVKRFLLEWRPVIGPQGINGAVLRLSVQD